MSVQTGSQHYQVHQQTGHFVGLSSNPLPPVTKGHTGRRYFELDTGITRICTGLEWKIWHREESYVGEDVTADSVPDGGDVPAGATFWETDTGLEWVSDGNAWVKGKKYNTFVSSSIPTFQEAATLPVGTRWYQYGMGTYWASWQSDSGNSSGWQAEPRKNPLIGPDDEAKPTTATVTEGDRFYEFDSGDRWHFHYSENAWVRAPRQDPYVQAEADGAPQLANEVPEGTPYVVRETGDMLRSDRAEWRIMPRRDPLVTDDPSNVTAEDYPQGTWLFERDTGDYYRAEGSNWRRDVRAKPYIREDTEAKPTASGVTEGTELFEYDSGDRWYADQNSNEWRRGSRVDVLVVNSASSLASRDAGDWPNGTRIYVRETGETHVADNGNWRRLPRRDVIVGESSSSKPNATEYPEGTRYYERDTGDIFVGEGSSNNWRRLPRGEMLVGDSGDSKPGGYPEGTRFFEEDTGWIAVYDGSNWHNLPRKNPLVGLSTEAKPAANSVPEGTRFYEYDTEETYISDGTDWRQYLVEVSGAGGGGVLVRSMASGVRPANTTAYAANDAFAVGELGDPTPASAVFEATETLGERWRITFAPAENSHAPAGSGGNSWILRITGGQGNWSSSFDTTNMRVELGIPNNVHENDITTRLNNIVGVTAVRETSGSVSWVDSSSLTADYNFSGGVDAPYQRGPLEFTDLKDGVAIGARYHTDRSGWDVAMRLHLFNAEPTAPADNGSVTVANADVEHYLGYIEIPASPIQSSGNAAAAVGDQNLPVTVDADDKIWGLLEVMAAQTPSSGQEIEVELTVAAAA